MVKIKELIKIINNNLGKNVIFAFQGQVPPPKPYISVQVLNIEQKNRRGSLEKLPDLMAKKKLTNHVNVTLQFNCIGKDLFESKQLGLDLYDLINFKAREILWESKIGVVRVGEILERTVLLENTKYEYINNLDVVVEYERDTEYNIENLNSIVIDEGTKVQRRK